jgi:hypothetical protein
VSSPDSIGACSQWPVLPATASADERTVVRGSVDCDDSDRGDADVANGAGDDGDDDTDEDDGSGRSTVWAEAKTHTVDQTGMQACVALHRIPHSLDLDGCCQRMHDDTNDVASNLLDLRTTTRCKQPESSGHKVAQRGQAECGC